MAKRKKNTIKILKGYYVMPMTFQEADGTKETREGGWITDKKKGSAYALVVNDTIISMGFEFDERFVKDIQSAIEEHQTDDTKAEVEEVKEKKKVKA